MQFDASTRARIVEAIQAAASAHATLVWALGEKDASRTWAAFSKKQRGRPRGSTNLENDYFLLMIYYEKLSAFPKKKTTAQIPRLIATELYKQFGGKYGASVPAIIKKLNRLLNAKKAADSRALDAFLQRMSKSPRTTVEAAEEARRRIGRTQKGRI